MHGELVTIYHRAVHGFFAFTLLYAKNVTSDGYFYTVVII